MHDKIEEPVELFIYLLEELKFPRKKAKKILFNKALLVNGKIQTAYNYQLKKGDEVMILPKTKETDLKIIYEDQELVVIIKENGLLTISTEKEKVHTAYQLVSDYVKQSNPKHKIYVIHRLDRETSGILMFAKNMRIKNTFQENWDKIVSVRKYYALVEGVVKQSGKVETFLKEDKNYHVYSTKDQTGKLAITEYQVLKNNPRYTLLDVELKTGRKNQIRVHMNDIGHPIVGDKKYGATSNPIRRLGLHAYHLELTHPITGKKLQFKDELPSEFKLK